MSNEMNTQEEKKVLTQKDLNKAMFRWYMSCLLYTSPSTRDGLLSRMPSSA